MVEKMMKAVVRDVYGLPEDLRYTEVEVPEPRENEVLVRVKAVSLNQSDWEFLTGKPLYARLFGFFVQNFRILGTDVTGVVESVGRKVTKFAPGDEVYGDTMGVGGGFAEFAAVPEKMLHKKPPSVTFEEVSTIPQAGIIALQGLRWGGELQPGQKVLINGAGGGSGMFAIQLAKMKGAEVTGVDNDLKLQHMLDVGADHVIDYRKTDFVDAGVKYDHILDLVATRSVFRLPRALVPGGTYAMVGGKMSCLLSTLTIGRLVGLLRNVKLGVLGANPNEQDFNELIGLMESKKVRLTIDQTYPLEETSRAVARLGAGEAVGKLVVLPGSAA